MINPSVNGHGKKQSNNYFSEAQVKTAKQQPTPVQQSITSMGQKATANMPITSPNKKIISFTRFGGSSIQNKLQLKQIPSENEQPRAKEQTMQSSFQSSAMSESDGQMLSNSIHPQAIKNPNAHQPAFGGKTHIASATANKKPEQFQQPTKTPRPMEGKQAQVDPFDPLTNHLYFLRHTGPRDKGYTTTQKTQEHQPSPYGRKEDEFKAKVFRKFDLNMLQPGYDNGSQVVFLAQNTDHSPLPYQFESVDILDVGNEMSM